MLSLGTRARRPRLLEDEAMPSLSKMLLMLFLDCRKLLVTPAVSILTLTLLFYSKTSYEHFSQLMSNVMFPWKTDFEWPYITKI